MHRGPTIKYNANQRYATTSVTAFLLKELARRSNIPLQVPSLQRQATKWRLSPRINMNFGRFSNANTRSVQEFVVRNDSPCGTTIGPILSANCGIRTIDIGCPQLSMHSIREMCGTDDVTHAINLLKVFNDNHKYFCAAIFILLSPSLSIASSNNVCFCTHTHTHHTHRPSMLILPNWTPLCLSTERLGVSTSSPNLDKRERERDLLCLEGFL